MPHSNELKNIDEKIEDKAEGKRGCLLCRLWKRGIFARILLLFLAFILLRNIAITIYLHQYAEGDAMAKAAVTSSAPGVSVWQEGRVTAFVPVREVDAVQEDGNSLFWGDDEISTSANVGIVLYPGAKVRAEAYAPLAVRLAEQGYLCLLIDMPVNLALLDSDAALGQLDHWPTVEKWYIGGHSLGGFGAETCARKQPDVFDGLIMLGSRLRNDFSDCDLPILGIYGTCDGICDPESVQQSDVPTPRNMTTVWIEGGCHSYFGYYGDQRGDGEPTISREEQQDQILQAILNFLE